MSGIFYDPATRRLHNVAEGTADPSWTLVTHNLLATEHHCRRILREILSREDALRVDFTRDEQHGQRRSA